MSVVRTVKWKKRWGGASRLDVTSNEFQPSVRLWYISDIHIENLLERGLFSGESDSERIRQLVMQLMESISFDQQRDVLLVAGDVAHTFGYVKDFYEQLSCYARGRVIGVLGNHELWCEAGQSEGVVEPSTRHETVDKVFDRYKSALIGSARLLNNSLAVVYGDNYLGRILYEDDLTQKSDDELERLLRESLFCILGGTGFTGNNENFNANSNLYKDTVRSVEKDKSLSRRFERVYERMRRVYSDRTLVVLTHMPMESWSNGRYEPNWIYVNGHTHSNKRVVGEGTATILADNQIGYAPRPSELTLKSYKIGASIFDPFSAYEDGIYPITSDDYLAFLDGRGIECTGCDCPGQLYMLKRGQTYMFVVESKASLCLLEGGQRHRLKVKDVNYYFDAMEGYAGLVREEFRTYRLVQQSIAEEIRSFGGLGSVHGAIIDIDGYRHVHLDPLTGALTCYQADNPDFRQGVGCIEDLLSDRYSFIFAPPRLQERYLAKKRCGKVPLLGGSDSDQKILSAKVVRMPIESLGRGWYKTSHIMRGIQYLLDYDLIRVWHDDVAAYAGFPVPEPRKRIKAQPVERARLTDEQKLERRAKAFAEKVAERSGHTVSVDPSTYKGCHEKVSAKCLTCGYEWAASANSLLSRRCWCPRCHAQDAAK